MSEQTRPAVHGTQDRKRIAIGSAIGTTIENYDFLLYSTAAALYFGDAFFPSEDPAVGVLLSFLTFGVGFAARPLGGVIGGHLGDKYGRKPVLVFALLLMGISTVLIGLLPTYGQIGLAAPILLGCIRILQGLAFGAEWGGAILMTFEHAPWRNRGAYTAIPQAGIPLGLLLANIAYLSTNSLPGDLAWRVPFLLSAILIVAGIVIRLKVEESPEFSEAKAEGTLSERPVMEVLRNDWRTVLRVIALRLAETGGFYIVVTYLLSYVASHGLATRTTALTGLIIATSLAVGATVLFGHIGDRVGRRPMYLFGTCFMIAAAFPIFLLVNSGAAVLVISAYILGLTFVHANLSGNQGAWFCELFSTRTRASGASLGYQFAAAIVGFVPFLAGALAVAFGWVGVALIYLALGAIGLLGALLTRETWGKAERHRVQTLAETTPLAVLPVKRSITVDAV